MGGGLFGTSLTLNPKCLVFSAFVLAVYWLPHPKNYRILAAFFIACLSYVLLAWYDVIYDCKDRLQPTILGWLWGWAKPPEYRDLYNKLPERDKKIVKTFDIFILFVLFGLAFYPYIYP